jgi:hypothetical protein
VVYVLVDYPRLPKGETGGFDGPGIGDMVLENGAAAERMVEGER